MSVGFTCKKKKMERRGRGEGGKRLIVFSMYDAISTLSLMLCCHIYNGEKNSIVKGTLNGHCHEGLLKQLDTNTFQS